MVCGLSEPSINPVWYRQIRAESSLVQPRSPVGKLEAKTTGSSPQWFEKFSPGDLPIATHPLKLKSESHIFQGRSFQKWQATLPAPSSTSPPVCLLPETVEETICLKGFCCLVLGFLGFLGFWCFFEFWCCLVWFGFLVSCLSSAGRIETPLQRELCFKFVSPSCLRMNA